MFRSDREFRSHISLESLHGFPDFAGSASEPRFRTRTIQPEKKTHTRWVFFSGGSDGSISEVRVMLFHTLLMEIYT